jgi:hypothetical protein
MWTKLNKQEMLKAHLVALIRDILFHTSVFKNPNDPTIREKDVSELGILPR